MQCDKQSAHLEHKELLKQGIFCNSEVDIHAKDSHSLNVLTSPGQVTQQISHQLKSKGPASNGALEVNCPARK